MDTLIRRAVDIPVRTPTPVVSFSPVVLPAPGRPVDLEVRVAAPATGRDLPVILLSHGHGNSNYLASRRGYGPLVDFYAAHGGAGFNGPAAERFPALRNLDFATMTTPALVVAGDKDLNPMFSDRVGWRAESYALSPGPKCLLTVYGGEHILGGISGYDAAETTDESPERVAVVQRLTWAYLRTALDPEDTAWPAAQAALADAPEPPGRIECK